MKKIKYLIGLITAVLAFTSYSVMAADAVVKEAYFKQNNEVVHTLSNGGLECVINASGINNDAVMINAIYEKILISWLVSDIQIQTAVNLRIH